MSVEEQDGIRKISQQRGGQGHGDVAQGPGRCHGGGPGNGRGSHGQVKHDHLNA